MKTSHFSKRTILGSPKDDILITRARPNERLYGGKGDDILISYGFNNHLHGGSGADTFAFMQSDKQKDRKKENQEIIQHFIHDFNEEEGDVIDLSHMLDTNGYKKVRLRNKRIKGKGIEVQFVPGTEKTVNESKRSFAGIENGVNDALGEIPKVTRRGNRSDASKYKVFVKGDLHHEIVLKHVPGKTHIPGVSSQKSDSQKKQRSINQQANGGPSFNLTFEGCGLPWEMTKSCISERNQKLQDFYEQNSKISITPQGIPFHGNGAKIDIKPPIEIFGGMEHWDSPDIKVKAEWKPPFVEVEFSFYADMYLGINLGPKFTLFTGSIPAKGTLPTYGPSAFNYSETLEFDPPFDVRASGGVGLSGTVDVTQDGLNKAISSEALYKAELDFSLSQHGPYLSTFTERSVNPLTVAGGSNSKNFDNLTGVTAKVSISPNIQFDVGLGVSGDGWHADLIDGGPKISAPIDIIIDGIGSGIQFNGARLDWVTRVIDIGIKGFSISGYEWTQSIANMGELGMLYFGDVCMKEETGGSAC